MAVKRNQSKTIQNSLFKLWILVTFSYSVNQSIVAGKKVIALWFHFQSLSHFLYFDKTTKGKFKEKMRGRRKYRKHKRVYRLLFISSRYQGVTRGQQWILPKAFGSSSISLNLRYSTWAARARFFL